MFEAASIREWRGHDVIDPGDHKIGELEAVYVDTGSSIERTVLQPSLTVRATSAAVTVSDDGLGVKATLRGGGHTVKTSAAGKASLSVFRRGTHVTVTAAGYAASALRKS